VLRALFGIGMGGEWGVARLSPWKKFHPDCAGFFPGCCSRDTRLGYLLAVVVLLVFPLLGLAADVFIGGLPALLGVSYVSG